MGSIEEQYHEDHNTGIMNMTSTLESFTFIDRHRTTRTTVQPILEHINGLLKSWMHQDKPKSKSKSSSASEFSRPRPHKQMRKPFTKFRDLYEELLSVRMRNAQGINAVIFIL